MAKLTKAQQRECEEVLATLELARTGKDWLADPGEVVAKYHPRDVTARQAYWTPPQLAEHLWGEWNAECREGCAHEPPFRVLDPCAGAGALLLGMEYDREEALGEYLVDAVELEEESALVGSHLVAPWARWLQADAFQYLELLRGRYELVLLNPPYGTGYASAALPAPAQKLGKKRQAGWLWLATEALREGGHLLLLGPPNVTEQLAKYGRELLSERLEHLHSLELAPEQGWENTSVVLHAHYYRRTAAEAHHQEDKAEWPYTLEEERLLGGDSAASDQPKGVLLADLEASAEVYEVPLDSIDPSPFQPRTFSPTPEPDLLELAENIRQSSVHLPVILRLSPSTEGRYELVAGERRVRASRLAEKSTVPAIVRELSDEEAELITVVENLKRKNLKPWEESAGVAHMLKRKGWGVEEVALELGQTPAWVARRAQVFHLCPEWRRLVRDVQTPHSKLAFGHLELVARLPHDQQRKLLTTEYSYLWPADGERRSVSYLREQIQRRLLMKLSAAPWKLDDAELVPKAGACSACPKRSTHKPRLWDEGESDAGELGMCLDRSCWEQKEGALVQISIDRSRELHGKKVVLLSRHWSAHQRSEVAKGARHAPDFTVCKKTAKGAVPVVYVDGDKAGRRAWAKPWNSSARSQLGKAAGPKPLAERRAQLRKLRLKLAIASLFAEIEQVEQLERLPDLRTVALLVAVFGTKYSMDGPNAGGGYERFAEHGVDYSKLRTGTLREWGALQQLLALDLAAGEDAARVVLWRSFLKVLSGRLVYRSDGPIEQQWTEVCGVAELVGVDAQPHLEEAERAKPEPKTWANLKADGTPKRKGKRKRAAKGKA